MNKLTSIRIKQEDGTYSEKYPISVLAENVVWEQGQSNSLTDILGQVSFNTNGSIQHQIDVLDNKKFNTSDLNTYLAGQISTDVASWLNTNVNPVGSAVTVDESLSISGSAADAKITGDNLNNVKSHLNKFESYIASTLLNGYDKNSVKSSNGYWSNLNGNFVSNSNFLACNKYAPVKSSTKYSLWYGDGSAGRYCYVCWYDVQKRFISGSNMPSSNIITSPANAYYVRLSVQKDKVDYVFCEGETYTGYHAYGIYAEMTDNVVIPDVVDIKKEFAIFSYTSTEETGYMGSNGEVNSSETSFHCLVTNDIECKQGDKFKYTGSGKWGAYSYVTLLYGTVVDAGQIDGTDEITIPSGVDSIRFSSFAISSNTIVLNVKRIYPVTMADKIKKNTEDIETIKEQGALLLKDIKIDIIGDSWSAVNDTADTKYTNLLITRDQANLNVIAYSGSGFHKPTSGNKPFYTQANSVRTDADIVLIFGSFNDVSDIVDGTTIGDVTDSGTTTICGCINTTINNILSRNPAAKILFMTPGAWAGYNANNDGNNVNNPTALLYVKAIEDVCYKRGYPCFDALRSMNLKPWINDFKTAYQPDGTHPNNAGHLKYVYPVIKHYLESFVT